MAEFGELLRRYIEALGDPTRGGILLELEQAGELTATQLAWRLGLTANNVYHHMRVLRRLGVVDAPRVVPGSTYVEKYYRLPPELRAMIGREPGWMDRMQATLSAGDRQALLVGMCLTAAQLLQRAAKRYQAMAAEELDEVAYRQQLAMVSIAGMGRGKLRRRLAALREVLRRESDDVAGEAAEAPSDLVLLAGLPLLWEEADGPP